MKQRKQLFVGLKKGGKKRGPNTNRTIYRDIKRYCSASEPNKEYWERKEWTRK